MIGAIADQPIGRRVLGHRGVRLAQHHVEADAQPALIDGFLVKLHLGPIHPRVRDAGQAFGEAFPIRQLDDLELLGQSVFGGAGRLPPG